MTHRLTPTASTVTPWTWTTGDGVRVDVSRTYCHVHLTVTGGPAVITPAAARDLAAALTRLADSVDPEATPDHITPGTWRVAGE